MLSNNSTKLMEIINDILSEISDWVWEVNKLGFFTYYSEGLKEFLGLTTKKMHELNLFDLFPNLQPKNLARLKEFRDYMKSKNKGMFEVILRAKPFFDNTTSLKGFRGTVKILDKIDVKTKNKEKYLPLIIKKFDDVILIIDEQYIIENKVRFNETSNYKSMEKDILNKSFLDLCHPNDIAELKGFLQKLKKGSENNRIECKILQGDGDYLWYDIRGLFFKEEKNALKYILILRNITTTRQKELLLYETVEKYQSFISNASEIAFSMDLDLRNLIIATPLETILGYFPDELKKKKIEDLLTSKSISNLKNIFKKELEDKKNPQDISKRVFFVDIEFIRKDCTTIILNVLISFLKNPDDNIQGIVGNLLKMTFYEDIKSKLLESEERYRTLFESSPHAIVLSNLKGEILGLNSKAEQLSGFKSSIFKGKKFQDLNLFPKEFFPLVMKDFIDLLKGKPAKLREIQIYKKDLTPNWVLYQGSMLNLKGEKIIQVIIQDIQDYKLIETKLRKSEKLYRNLFDNSPFGIWIVNSDGLIVDCNEGFNRYISDVPKEKIIGDSFVNMLTRIKGSKHKHSQIDHTYGNIRDDHCSKQVEFQAIGIDNKKIWITIENTIIKINKDIFFQIIIRNISDTKEAELKLQEFNKDLECQIEERTKELKLSEKHLLLKNEEQTLLLDNIDTQIWYLKDENTYGAVNKAHANFLGFNQELFENKKLDEILSNKDLEDSLANNIEVFKNKRQVRTESLMTDKFGSQRLLSIIKTPKLNESGEVEFVVCAAEDITNRHKTEARLKESESRFRTMTEQSLMGILILQDGLVKYANHAIEEITGYTIKEVISWKKFEMKKVFHPDDFLFLTNNLVEITQNKQKMKEVLLEIPNLSFKIVTKFGKVKWIDAYARQIEFQGKSAILATMLDITDKKTFEESLIESERKLREQNIELRKLDELKTDFITIAAHELKTPLISIIGFVDLILTRNKDLTMEVKEDLERVLGNAIRLQGYIEQLMDVLIIDAKKIDLKKTRQNIKNIIIDCVAELDYQINKKSLNLEIKANDNVEADVDEFRLMQIFTNLISNAIKFSKEKGKIKLIIEDRQNNLLCTIQDFGMGLSNKEIDQLFRKFVSINRNIETFSALERGSGLGLYITKGLVEAHGGKIWVKSMGKNLGAEFSFTLPK